MAPVSSCLATIAALITLSKFVCDSTPCYQTRFTKTYIEDIDDEYSSLLMNVSDVSHFECSRTVSRDPLLLWFVYNTETRECATSEKWDIPTTEVLNSNNVLFQKVGVDGVFTTWSSWGPCSVTCGSYDEVRTRTRSCTNPPPYNGGEDCVGHTSETKSFYCDLPICPVNGQWSDWGTWSPPDCSGVCDTDATDITQTRSKSCTNPSPANGGTSCSGSSSETNTLYCTMRPCLVFDYNFGSCTIDNDCSQNMICSLGNCVCPMDLVYDGSSCVQSCSTYGNIFATYHRMVINGYNNRQINGVTLAECRQLCIDETDFTCKTADFLFGANTCYLSSTTVSLISPTDFGSAWYELVRNC